jgi:hypothetical protein
MLLYLLAMLGLESVVFVLFENSGDSSTHELAPGRGALLTGKVCEHTGSDPRTGESALRDRRHRWEQMSQVSWFMTILKFFSGSGDWTQG